MTKDIDQALEDWPFRPNEVCARWVHTKDDRQVIQMRTDLGVRQMEITGRPDGQRPNGFATYLDYLRNLAGEDSQGNGGMGELFMLTDEQCHEVDRELMQYYHRRISWLALGQYTRATQDADHTLALMDFIKQHSPDREYLMVHEQYRGFVLFHHTQAAAHAALEQDDPRCAIERIRAGLTGLEELFQEYGIPEEFDDNEMVRALHSHEQYLREQYDIGASLEEQLDEAVANEDFERAALLRDKLRHNNGG